MIAYLFYSGESGCVQLHRCVLLATSLVADLQLVAAALVWGFTLYVMETPLTATTIASIVSLSGGALLANLTSVILLVVETVTFRR